MAAKKPKVTFGTCCTSELKYVIVILRTDNTIRYVTDVAYVPCKECRWEDGKKAYFFSDRRQAEDVCFGLNANGSGAFVMTIPDYFEEDYFKNQPKEPEEAAKENG